MRSPDPAALKRVHDAFLRDMRQAIGLAAEDAGAVARDHVRLKSNFIQRKPDSTSLKTTTEAKFARLPGGAIVRISAIKNYASFIERGTKTITPRWFLQAATTAAFAHFGRSFETHLGGAESKFRTAKI